MVLLQEFLGYKQGAVAPKQTWRPFIFISKFKFQKISVQVLFQWNDLKYQTCLPKQTKHKTVHKGSVANSMVNLGNNSCSTMGAAQWYWQLFENYWLWKRDNRLLNHCCWLHSWCTISSLIGHAIKTQLQTSDHTFIAYTNVYRELSDIRQGKSTNVVIAFACY